MSKRGGGNVGWLRTSGRRSIIIMGDILEKPTFAAEQRGLGERRWEK